MIDVDDVAIYGVELRRGDEMRCPKCGFPLGIDTKIGTFIHTERGWLPFELPTSALLPFIYQYMKRKGLWREEWDEYFEEEAG
ncbi:MAG: hypothetical protein DRJ67_10385, partial [Thermoprotei archaeon]